MKRFAWSLFAVVAMAFAIASPARAEVWGFVDDKGVAHFAQSRVDDRYELYFRGGESFDTASGVGTPRAVAVPSKATSKLIAFFEFSPSYKQVQHHLRAASKASDIDYELLKAVIATESGFDAGAVSPKGAIGLMQVMPATAQRYGVSADKKTSVQKKLADPGVNVKTGARYLRELMDMYSGNLELALAAYNAGEGAVLRAGKRVPNFPETQNYVKTVLQLYAMLRPPSSLASGRASAPGRVRMEIPATPLGGAVGRGNLPGPQANKNNSEPPNAEIAEQSQKPQNIF